MGEKEIITGNVFDKYNSGNPVYRKLMSNFFSNLLHDIVNRNKKDVKILELGCGEGLLACEIKKLFPNFNYTGLDINDEIISEARKTCPDTKFEVGSIYELKEYYQEKFDYVIVSEVLEHIEEPLKALTEIHKLNSDRFIFSVPNEPIWRFLNMMRLKYLKDFGNTPGHIQHWSKKAFKMLIQSRFNIIEYKSVFPWLIALCDKK
ncbi:MAG: class I SAM-dependent methyltransferase [Bacteroidales bacterium]|nr:class I SAM-dependent methyltransferase [Bacteroidales bacterium]